MIYGIEAFGAALPPLPGAPARFISVGNDVDYVGPLLFTSENDDASTWVNRSAAVAAVAPEVFLFCVTYSPSLDRWVAGGYDSGAVSSTFATPQVVYSDDGGNTWALGTPNPSTDFFVNSICWSGTSFIAVGHNSASTAQKVMTSPDGITWTSRTGSDSAALWRGVTAIGSLALAVGDNSSVPVVMKSTNDGASWSAVTLGGASISTLYGVLAVASGTHVLVGQKSTNGVIRTSTDGSTWTDRTVPTDNVPYSVAWNGSIYAAVGADFTTVTEGRAVSSPDGTTWTARTTDPVTAAGSNGPNFLSVAAVSGGGFCAAGRDDNAWDRSYTMYSADGQTWVARNAVNSVLGPLFGVGVRP